MHGETNALSAHLGIAELKIRLGPSWSILSTFWTSSCLRVKARSSAAICWHQICRDSWTSWYSLWFRCQRYVL